MQPWNSSCLSCDVSMIPQNCYNSKGVLNHWILNYFKRCTKKQHTPKHQIWLHLRGLFIWPWYHTLKHFDATLLCRLLENTIKDQITQTWTMGCIQLLLDMMKCPPQNRTPLSFVCSLGIICCYICPTQGLRPTQVISSKDYVLGILCSCLWWDISSSRPTV